LSLEIVGVNVDEVVVESVVVVSVDVELVVVSVGAAVVPAGAVDVVSVSVGVVSSALDEDAAIVSVVADDGVAPPVSSPKATAERSPITNIAAIAIAIHDFFRGPPFFASGAI